LPVGSGFAVEAMSDQLFPSVEDCHLKMLPVWPVRVMVVLVPLHIAAAAGVAVPPTGAGLTDNVAGLEVAGEPHVPLTTTSYKPASPVETDAFV
jgi:hypothetical protein